jgi:aminoglycoside phosphotransferase (APT) family kinase protein
VSRAPEEPGAGGVEQRRVADLAAVTAVARRVFPARSVWVEPASPGRLLVVYRIRADDATYYLRVAEEAGEDLGTDAAVLERLAGMGVRVPAVVHVDPAPPELDRSVLVIAALPGRSLAESGSGEQARRAARAAGHDAALIASVPVEGFGWLRRDGRTELSAGLGSYAEFVAGDLPGRWPGWLAGAFTVAELDALHGIVEQERRQPAEVTARLAHGDLDVTHIWLDGQGRYAGLIDFGEMRGGDPHFDLGHFLLHDRETRPEPLFEAFLAGYAEASPLAGDYRERIRRSAILSGLRQLSIWLGPGRGASPADRMPRQRAAELRGLLAAGPGCGPQWAQAIRL